MSLRLLVLLLAVGGFPATAAELEFQGTPSVKVETIEGATESTPVPPHRAHEVAVRVVKTANGYAWASRNNVPLVKSESGAYITYVAPTGAGYVRVLIPSMRNAIQSLPKKQREGEILYMEHMVNQLGSITYFGK